MAKKNALVRFYYNVDPNTLNDDDWADAIESIYYVLKLNGTIKDKE